METWQLITGEYPPRRGGVSDYSQLVARGLAEAGDNVDVWAPDCNFEQVNGATEVVHRLPDHFGPSSLAAMNRALNETKGHRVLVQYVPHAFGAKAMNLPFCAWLFSRRDRMPIDVMFHEVAFPIRRNQPIRHNFLGIVTRMMALMVARAATRVFVAIPAWEQMLHSFVGGSRSINWLPVPSNIPVANDSEGARSIKRRYCPTQKGFLIGHFGTYGEWISRTLKASLLPVLEQHSDVFLLLIGSNSDGFRSRLLSELPRLSGCVHATGELNPWDVSRHITMCDLMVQPYPDGVTGRRGSAMAALSHGRAMVTTSGHLTEPLWHDSRAVAIVRVDDAVGLSSLVEDLIRNKAYRQQLARAGRRLYSERFDVTHTIAALRDVERESR